MSAKKVTIGLASAFGLAVAASQFVFVVEPSDMANVRRMGNMVHQQPLGEGPHFMIPMIDKVDTIQVDLRTLHIPAFKVNTVDNQQITLEMNFNYTVPAESVNRLLYQVGKVGGGEVDVNIIRVAMDRASRIFSTKNTTLISGQREDIQREVTNIVFQAVKDQFGIEPHSLQFSQIALSDAFIASNEAAVLAKNTALLEQNRERIKTAQAQQAVIRSEGEAKVAIEAARGESQSALIQAGADKLKAELEGQAQSALTSAGIKVFGDVATYNRYLEARTKLKWDGVRPQVSVEGGGATTVVVPKP